MSFSALSFDAARLSSVSVCTETRAAELVFAGVREHGGDGQGFGLRARFAQVRHVTGLLDLVTLELMGEEGNVSGAVTEHDADGARWRFPLTAGCLMIEGGGVELERV